MPPVSTATQAMPVAPTVFGQFLKECVLDDRITLEQAEDEFRAHYIPAVS